MKKLFTIVSMTLIIPALTSCGGGPKGDMPWIVDRFDDIKVIRYEVPGFDALPLEEKELIYYLSEAAKCGRDILFDQNCPVNLPVRRTLETVYENYKGDRTTAEWKALEKYLKKVWFANGIHHHYSNDKFVPEFTEGYLLDAIETIPEEKFGSLNALRGEVCRAIFDPAVYPTKLNQRAGDDLLLTSSSNYYHNVSQAEAEAFYADMAAADAGNPEPVSYGLNSQLTKDDAGRICERVWKLGGMYSPAIERIVYWLEKAQAVAKEPQKTNIAALVSYYKTGDLKEFDRYNIGWVKDGLYDRVLEEIRQVKAACGGKLLYRGFGTQKAEEELAKLFPEARILRMDQDTTAAKDAHEKLLAKFARHEYDIMVGTQMVAKGLDFEDVTLVGVLASLFVGVLVGALAGYLAGRFMGTETSLGRNILMGVLGSFVGEFLFGLIGIHATGSISSFVISVLGACVCIWVDNRLFHNR